MNYITRIILLFVLILFNGTLAMSSCIAVTTVGGGHFWNEVKKGALQAGKEININIYHNMFR